MATNNFEERISFRIDPKENNAVETMRMFTNELERLERVLSSRSDLYTTRSQFLRSAVIMLLRIHELNVYPEVVGLLRDKQLLRESLR